MRERALLSLFLTVFVNLLGFGMVIPLLPYYASEYGGSGLTVGLIVGVYALLQFIFSPIWGRLSDRIGRRPVLLLCLTGAGVGHLLFGLATTVPLLLGARAVAGAFAATVGTAQAAAADLTGAGGRTRSMGIIGAAFGLGFVFGPPLGGFLAWVGSRHGMAGNLLPGAGAALFALLALAITFFALPETRPRQAESGISETRPPQFDPEVWREIFVRPGLRNPFLIFFILVMALAGLETIVPLYARDRFAMRPREIGYFFGLMGLVMAAVQGLWVGRLSGRFGERKLLMAGTLGMAAGFAILPWITVVPLLYLVAAWIAFSEGISLPTLQSVVSERSPRARSGTYLGMLAASGSLAQMVGPPFSGSAYDVGGMSTPFLAAAILGLFAFLAAIND
jgi:DHA1 family tetracycline resistance protein-like MFS transporter